jgi:hypothetical protein
VHTAARFFFVFVALGACAPPTPVREAAEQAPLPSAAQATATWNRLKATLPGTWTATTSKGTTVTESFRLVSSDSALVETYVTSSHRETISVYHPDHDRLLLTHYCAQGNQPRLVAVAATDESVVFRFLDVTNMAQGQAVLVEKDLVVRTDALEQTEIYRQPDGTLEKTLLQFSRTRADAT